MRDSRLCANQSCNHPAEPEICIIETGCRVRCYCSDDCAVEGEKKITAERANREQGRMA